MRSDLCEVRLCARRACFLVPDVKSLPPTLNARICADVGGLKVPQWNIFDPAVFATFCCFVAMLRSPLNLIGW